MEKYVVLVAGGKGVRMGTAIPKQFLPLLGKPILYYTVKAFVDAYPDIHLILVLPADQVSYAQMVLQEFPSRLDMTIVSGGATRYHSVQNGLNAVPVNSIVFVHDGVRPLISTDLIQRCYVQAVSKGSAIPAINVADSMRLLTQEGSRAIDRSQMRIIQTPQTFQSSILLEAFKQEYSEAFTDEATVAEASGHKVHLIEGEKRNIKITTQEDILIAEALLG
ncbi:MAG: 2-C-methyl-D-erythritol 4-phosphate cytidylyltransferase [Bacteroidota bacterium]